MQQYLLCKQQRKKYFSQIQRWQVVEDEVSDGRDVTEAALLGFDQFLGSKEGMNLMKAARLDFAAFAASATFAHMIHIPQAYPTVAYLK